MKTLLVELDEEHRAINRQNAEENFVICWTGFTSSQDQRPTHSVRPRIDPAAPIRLRCNSWSNEKTERSRSYLSHGWLSLDQCSRKWPGKFLPR